MCTLTVLQDDEGEKSSVYARVYEFDVLDAFDIIANEIIMIFFVCWNTSASI